MIVWMREFNASGRGHLQFTGFDMQYGSVALENVLRFLAEADPALYLARVGPLQLPDQPRRRDPGGCQRRPLGPARPDRPPRCLPGAPSRRAGRAGSFRTPGFTSSSPKMELGDALHRDRSMAENAEWILRQNPGARMVIWAHNWHVSRVPEAMGTQLAAKFGKDYLVVGQIFHEGAYSARAASGQPLSTCAAVPSFPGTIEYMLHSTELPQIDAGSPPRFGRCARLDVAARDRHSFARHLGGSRRRRLRLHRRV